MGKLKIKKPKPKRRKRRLPQAGEDAYYRLPKRADCGYEKRFRYNMSLGTYGVPAELLHWCSANCKHKWGWWFKNDHSWYEHWDHEKNEAFMSFNSNNGFINDCCFNNITCNNKITTSELSINSVSIPEIASLSNIA